MCVNDRIWWYAVHIYGEKGSRCQMFATVAAAAALSSSVHWGAQSLRHCPGFPTQVNPTASWRRPVAGWSGIEKCHICAVGSLPRTTRRWRQRTRDFGRFLITFFHFWRQKGGESCLLRPSHHQVSRWRLLSPNWETASQPASAKSSPPFFLAAATVEIKGRKDLKSWKADY